MEASCAGLPSSPSLCLPFSASPAVPAAAPPKPSWAQPQIEAVVEAGLLADTSPRFRRRTADPAGARRRARTLSHAARSRRLLLSGLAPAAQSRSASSMPRSSASSASETRPCRHRRARAAGLAPKAGAGPDDRQAPRPPLQPPRRRATHSSSASNDPATRAEAAYSLARLLGLSGWEQSRIRSRRRLLVLPELTDAPAPRARPRRLVRRLPVRLGRHLRAAAAAVRQAGSGRLRLLRLRLAGLQAGAVPGRVGPRIRAPRPHDLPDVGRGAPGAADPQAREPPARRPDLPGRPAARSRSPPRSATQGSTSAAAGSCTRPAAAPPYIRSKAGTATGSPGPAGRCAKPGSPSSRRARRCASWGRCRSRSASPSAPYASVSWRLPISPHARVLLDVVPGAERVLVLDLGVLLAGQRDRPVRGVDACQRDAAGVPLRQAAVEPVEEAGDVDGLARWRRSSRAR